MKERPIIFNAEMVRAILSGQKTQTRRALRIQPKECNHTHWPEHPNSEWKNDDKGWSCAVCGNGVSLTKRDVKGITCPFGKVGDRLWVRETWQVIHDYTDEYGNVDERRFARSIPKQRGNYWHPVYAERFGSENRDDRGFPWRPAIHMPRWASRITLEITDVRVERLSDISEEDCWAEGIDEIDGRFENVEIIDMAIKLGCCIEDAKPMFALLWQSIYGAESWDANPWVWVIEFKRMEATA
ncbi:hypothetical protein WCT87_07115 [Pectobacterium brasiliense]|uniref:hypothetical protein n=1 Tax=Pectobacterium brasiliense TaxID=180957 RepID=UPI003017863E